MKIFAYFLAFFFAAKAADIKDLFEGNRKFSGALYSDTPNWNSDLDVVLSPFSIQTVLAMTQSGARGVTAEEIRASVCLPNKTEDAEAAIQSALSTIQGKIANKIYVENGFSTNEDYKSLAENIYKSSFENVEFINSAAAAAAVNEWASAQTNNRFANYFAWSGDFSRLSKDLLINTLAVDKKWKSPFDSSQTKSEYFTAPDGSRYTVSMMTQGPYLYNYYESADLDAKILEMPLGDDTTFTMVLPNTLTGISKIEKQADLALTTPEYVAEYIQVSLPRTAIQATYLNLRSSLQRLGVKTAWHNDNADLSGMAGVPGELAAYNLIHDTFITIGETGIEAAAGGLVNVRVPETKHFQVNRAFFFYIKVNGIIVFVGKVSNPTYTIHH